MAERRPSAGSSALNAIAQFNAGVIDNTLGLLDLGAQGVAGISNMITGRNDRPVMLSQRAKSALNVESDPSSPSYIAGSVAPAVATGVGAMAKQGVTSLRNFFGGTTAELGGYFGGEAGAQIGREYGGTGGEIVGGLVGGMAAPNAPRAEVISAGHASPHNFDRFSMDKIGTGEGAQVFGHGLYFAENPRVVDEYYENFNQPVLRFKERNIDTPYTAELRDRFKDVYEGLINYDAAREWKENVLDRAYDAGLNVDEVDDQLNVLFKNVFEKAESPRDFDRIDFDSLGIDPNDIYDLADQQLILDNVLGGLSQASSMEDLNYVLEGFSPDEMRLYRDLVEPELAEIRDSASRYDVNLNVEPDELLDWDRPLPEQPKAFNAIKQLYLDEIKRIDENLPSESVKLSEVYQTVDDVSMEDLGLFDKSKGGQAYRTLANSNLGRGAEELSRKLKDKGIKGIKYFDGMSRNRGEGTRNYVMFDDSLVDTKRVNDQLTPSWMEQGARMQRAQDLGFDTSRPLYHSTNSSFDAFEVPEGGFLKYGKGVYTTPKPQYADRYIRENRDLESAYKEGANVMPLYARGNIATEKDWEAARQEMMSEGVTPSGYNQQQAELQRRLKEQGFDGLNMFGDEIIIFDPKNIRSINAEFDPTKADSADLLSSRQSERQMSALRGIA